MFIRQTGTMGLPHGKVPSAEAEKSVAIRRSLMYFAIFSHLEFYQEITLVSSEARLGSQ